MSDDFKDRWVFVSDAKKQLGATSYEFQELAPFRTGRRRARVGFFTREHCLIEEREAMHMVSKVGREYWVVSTQPWVNEPLPSSEDAYE